MGIVDRRPSPRLSLGQEFQHRLDRVALTAGTQRECRLFLIAPIETAFGISQEHIGGFEKAETGEDLAGIEQIDRDRGSAIIRPSRLSR